MKHDFIIVDTSGSIISDGVSTVAAINDLLRDMISELDSKGAQDIRIVTYSDKAQLYWSNSNGKGYLDMSDDLFNGRSNLGKAYEYIGGVIKSEKLCISDCSLVLISDGEATDNYKKQLLLIDPDKESYRVALSLGNVHITTEKHVVDDDLSFNGGIADRDAFIDKVSIFH